MSQQEFRHSAHADIAQLIQRAWRLRHDDTRQARGAAVRALDLAASRDDKLGHAWAALRLGVCDQILATQPATELDRLQHCIEAMRTLGDDAGQAEALNLLGNALDYRGRYEEALHVHARCQTLREALNDGIGVAHSLGNRVQAMLALGRWADARAAGLDCLRLARAAKDDRAVAYALVHQGLIELRTGNAELAASQLALAFSAASRTDDRALECTALTRLAQARVHLGDLTSASGLLAQAQAICRRTGNVFDAGCICMVQGLLAQANGDGRGAAAHFEAAMHKARQCGDKTLETEVERAREVRQPAASN